MPNPTITPADKSPLSAGYGPIEFAPDPEEQCSAPGMEGDCEVEKLHPAPAGQRWVQFVSQQALQPAPGDASLKGDVVLAWSDPEACAAFAGQPYGIWISDDSDELNGNVVNDGFLEGVNEGGCSVGPAGSRTPASGGALAVALAGLFAFTRRRRR